MVNTLHSRVNTMQGLQVSVYTYVYTYSNIATLLYYDMVDSLHSRVYTMQGLQVSVYICVYI